MLKNETLDYEESLRRLMVPLRTRIEAGRAYERAEVLTLLRQVFEYAAVSQDLRFQDCVTYYEELGFQLDAEAVE